MQRRNWKHMQPTSLRHALELCKEFAREKKNLSVERIAILMGLTDHYVLYKWLQTGRMPLVLMPAYEQVCGCHFVTRWLAGSAGKLLIDIPTGKTAAAEDTQQLQRALTDATGILIDFYNGTATAEAALAAITNGMEELAFQRQNVLTHATPQLDLGDA